MLSRRLVVGLGTAQIGAAQHLPGHSDDMVATVVSHAARCGVRLFDTAQNYGSEKGLGEGIKRSGVAREELFLSCKVDLDSKEDPVARMERQVTSSLANLSTSYLDSVVVHWPICLDDERGDHRIAREGAWGG